MTELDRRTLFKAGAAGAGGVLVASGSGLLTPVSARPHRGRTLAKNLVVPWGIAFLPNGDALVGERISARIYRVSRKGGKHPVGHAKHVRNDAGEGGLLGLAVHPNFRNNRWVYAYISAAHENRIVRMRFRNGKLGPQHLVLGGIPTASNHNGGRLTFGPDGMLYASTGDAGRSSRAQNRSSKAGKVLRMTPRGKVPAGNPFGNYTWSYGHRNVEGLDFDRRGQLWATEFGEKTRDELNKIHKGHNYGWPRVEGGDGPGGPVHDPFVTWHPTSSCSPSGVAIAHGRAYVGSLAGHGLFVVRLYGPHKRLKHKFYAGLGRVRTVQQAPDGSLWITTSNRDGRGNPNGHDDRVIRIRP